MNSTLPSPQRMQCMEIWGGNQATNDHFVAVGIEVFVHCAPFGESQVGGDVYYLTSCASGRITRMLLADISGHGPTISDLAIKLRDLLRQNVNTIDHQRFVEEMNREFGKISSLSMFATAAVLTYFEPKRTLSVGLAGHPNPLFYRASEGRWLIFDPEEAECQSLTDIPLGIQNDVRYPGHRVQVEPGDMFLIYSDAYVEYLDENDRLLGVSGLLEIVNGLKVDQPEQLLPRLRETFLGMNEGELPDDATLLLGHFTGTRPTVRDSLLAPFRLLGPVQDSTSLKEPEMHGPAE